MNAKHARSRRARYVRAGCIGCTGLLLLYLAYGLTLRFVVYRDVRVFLFDEQRRLPIDDYCVIGLWGDYALACRSRPTPVGELSPNTYDSPVLHFLDLRKDPIASGLSVDLREDAAAAQMHAGVLYICPASEPRNVIESYQFTLGTGAAQLGHVRVDGTIVPRLWFRDASLFLLTVQGRLIEVDVGDPAAMRVRRIVDLRDRFVRGFEPLAALAFTDKVTFIAGKNLLVACDPSTSRARDIVAVCGDRVSDEHLIATLVARADVAYVALPRKGCFVVSVSGDGKMRLVRRFARPYMDIRPIDIAMRRDMLYLALRERVAAYDITRPLRPRQCARGEKFMFRTSVYVSDRYVAFTNGVYGGIRGRHLSRTYVASDVYRLPEWLWDKGDRREWH